MALPIHLSGQILLSHLLQNIRMSSNYIASGRIVAPAGSQTAWESSNAAWILQAQTWIQEG